MIKNYKELKAKGLITLHKDDTYFYYALKQWNAKTGEQIAPEVEVIDVEELNVEKVRLNKQIIDIDELTSDLEKATDLEV